MPSDAASRPQRLHPVSLLFTIGSVARKMLLPGILVLFVAGGNNYELALIFFFVPAAIAAVVKYATYSYRLGDDEMMVREGVLTRNERHIPYARIQNINLVQNPFHRLLRVAEVHLETASGTKPEAIIRVLSLASVETIRERVFKNREDRSNVADGAVGEQADHVQSLLKLPTRELILLGLISNRGMAVIAAVMGVAWQFDLWGFDWSRIAEQAPKLTEKMGIPIEKPGLTATLVLGVVAVIFGILLMKFLSIVWALFRFHGFTLERSGRDLRARYGLFTRYTAAVPSNRIQLLSLRTTPLHRLWNRSGVLAETAGGGSGNQGEERSETHRLWLAPIIESDKVDALNRAILPDVDLRDAQWNRLPVRARRRIRNLCFVLSTPVTIVAIVVLGWWAIVVAAAAFVWSLVHAAQWWKHAAWTLVPTAMAFRSGWWTRRLSIVRFAKIQTVSLRQSPFDRRHDMARLGVDTAGAGKVGHRLSIPFLPREVAVELHDRLATEAAKRSFRW